MCSYFIDQSVNRIQISETKNQEYKMNSIKCQEHHNLADLLCLQPQCTNRLICYLCQHNHNLFSSIRKVTKIKYQQFSKKVDKEIDNSINLIKNQGANGTDMLIKAIMNYYDNIKNDLVELIEAKRSQNVKILSSSQNTDMGLLVKARIQNNYHQLDPQSFKKVKQVFQGKDLQTLARQQQEKNIEIAHTYMQKFNRELSSFLQNFNIKLSVRVPEIRLASSSSQFQPTNFNVEGYDQQVPSNKLKPQLIDQTINFQSMVSDCYLSNRQILATSYDKTLKVFDKNLKVIKTIEFGNIIMKLQSLGEDVYGIAVSKQIQISKISRDTTYDNEHIMWLRGHTQKITDLHSFNSRILGSCSDEGLKIWDLYKQKCQYTLKQKINPSCFNFCKTQRNIVVGYHDHQMKVYSIENMKPSRSYQLDGVPLYISQENRQNNLVYSGGFGSTFVMFDLRLPKQVFKHNFKSEAVSCFKQSIFQQDTVYIGERGGITRVFDLKRQKERLNWSCHPVMTNLSKPNGIVRIQEEAPRVILSAGCNDKKLSMWKLIDG